jgi:hypothetical protein
MRHQRPERSRKEPGEAEPIAESAGKSLCTGRLSSSPPARLTPLRSLARRDYYGVRTSFTERNSNTGWGTAGLTFFLQLDAGKKGSTVFAGQPPAYKPPVSLLIFFFFLPLFSSLPRSIFFCIQSRLEGNKKWPPSSASLARASMSPPSCWWCSPRTCASGTTSRWPADCSP